MRKKLQQVCVYLLVVVVCIGGAEWSRAQVQNASLTGLVTDPTGAAVRGASVTVRNSATNVAYTGESDAAGYYLFPSLSIGRYSVSVEVPGYRNAEAKGFAKRLAEQAAAAAFIARESIGQGVS